MDESILWKKWVEEFDPGYRTNQDSEDKMAVWHSDVPLCFFIRGMVDKPLCLVYKEASVVY